MRLRDRVALVTGAGSGIGRAIALRFAEEGARVVVNDVRAEAAEETVAALPSGAPPGLAVVADVADSAAVRAMFDRVEAERGGLDVLVNNAGIASAGVMDRAALARRVEARVMEQMAGDAIETHWDVTMAMPDAEWLRLIGVHLNGTFFCTREALRLMSRRNRGVIINLSSVAALAGLPLAPHYSAAKGGILAFTRAVAQEVGSRGIRVNAICPGFIDTPMTEPLDPISRRLVIGRTPLGRFGTPEEIAATALFLASDEAAFYTGQWLSPNGGLYM